MPIRTAPFIALRVCLPVALLGVPAACGPDGTTDAMTDGSSESSGDTTGGPATATTMPGTTTAMPGSTSMGDDTSSTTAMVEPDSSGGSSDEAGFIPRPDAGGPSDPYPLGEQCEADRECASGSCFLFPGLDFGLCSECALDSDCMIDGGPGTCSFGQAWAVCTGGEAGTMCQSSEGCEGDLVCAPIFEVNPFQYCSECATDAECDEGNACTPGNLGNYCATPGSIENHAPCPEAGGAYCMSTHCTEALYDGMSFGIFVCGECTVDTDCAEGQTCTPAFLTDMDLSGSVCT